jgi:2-polyprenyl-6-methoxyphenol hydroxylase-like FAD-dependent oxidoreductase
MAIPDAASRTITLGDQCMSPPSILDTTDVLVAGAGPVGLTLAMELAERGIRVVIVESRAFEDPPSVKSNHVSARSMEIFRRHGLASRIRDAGLPADYPNDISFRISVTGAELARIPIPCRERRYTETKGPDANWPTPEPPHRINQIYLEPILLEHVSKLPGVVLENRTRFLEFQQDESGVTSTLVELDTGVERQVRSRYVVGCDGGRSEVRRLIGATFQGTAVVQRVQSTYIRAPELAALIPGKPSWYSYALNPRRCGAVIAIDGRERWIVHNHLNPEEPSFDSVDRDRSLRDILGVGREFSYDILSKEDWVGRRLVADRFRRGRAFIAGDAAHLWVPYAGYGMNAGIADAGNLAWLLAARLGGWGGEAMLDAYEAERQPITQQVSTFAMEHAQKVMAARRGIPADIEQPGPEGDALRADIGRNAYAVNVPQFCCAGLNFGYFYAASPILVADQEAAPEYSMGDYKASTVPGCRAPHFWLHDGRSVYDAFGLGYTLLCFDPLLETGMLEEAALRMGMPLVTLKLHAERVPDAYRHALVLCRADQHVAWRAHELPEDPDGLIRMLCGKSVQSSIGHHESRDPMPQIAV